ncbi:hypothetical protein D3C80_1802380 [compost metagenome]
MQDVVGDCDPLFQVPDRQIRIGAHSDCTLAWMEAIKLGIVRGGQRDKTRKIDTTLHDTFAEQDRQSRLQPWNAVGNRPE